MSLLRDIRRTPRMVVSSRSRFVVVAAVFGHVQILSRHTLMHPRTTQLCCVSSERKNAFAEHIRPPTKS